jgi:hypothetical protein
MKIKIITDTTGTIEAIITEENPITGNAIYNALPLNARANTWGDEIYFRIPVNIGKENAKEVVEIGDLAYWPPGNALCIFFGKTPISKGNEIRPASAVNVFGKLVGEFKAFKQVNNGDKIRIEKIS